MSENKAGQRLHFIDMMKGLAIIVIALYHILLPSGFKDVTNHCCGPILVVFFCLSGYFYRPGKKTYKENLASRAKSLLVPFFKYSLIFWAIGTLYHMIVDKMSFTDTLCCLRNFYGGCIWNRVLQNLFGWDYHNLGKLYMFLAVFWFLLALFFAFVLFLIFADKALASTVKSLAGIGILLTVEAVLLLFNVNLPYNIQNTPYYAALLLAGAFFNKVDLFALPEKKLHKVPDWVAGGILLLISLVMFFTTAPVTNLYRGTFGTYQVPSMLLLTLESFLFLWGLGVITRRIELSGMRIKELAYIGENSLYVFLFHNFFAYFISAFTGFALASAYSDDNLPTTGNQVLAFLLAIVCIALSLGVNALISRINRIKK